MEEINENKSFKVVLDFYDEDNNPVTPDEAFYSILDDNSDTFIVSNQRFIPSSSQYVLVISSEHNQILNDKSRTEKRRLTITWSYASGNGEGAEEIVYLVKNLKGIKPTE